MIIKLEMCAGCFLFGSKATNDEHLLLYPSGGGPVHARVPILSHPLISPKQSQLHNKLPMYMINLVIIYVVVNSFCMKNHKSLRKLRVGVNRYTGVNWSTTTRESMYT